MASGRSRTFRQDDASSSPRQSVGSGSHHGPRNPWRAHAPFRQAMARHNRHFVPTAVFDLSANCRQIARQTPVCPGSAHYLLNLVCEALYREHRPPH